MTNVENQDKEDTVIYLVDDSVVANSNTAESVDCLEPLHARGSGIFSKITDRIRDTLLDRPIELANRALRSWSELDGVVGH